MDTTRPLPQQLISLQDAAIKLDVPVSQLLRWNEVNILKPTITHTGHVGYTQLQLEEFIRIKNLQLLASTPEPITNPQPEYTHVHATHPSHSRLLSSSFVLFSSMSFVIILSLVLATRQDKVTALLHQYEQNYQSNQSQASSTSQVDVNSPIAFSLSQQQSQEKLGKNETNSPLSKELAANATNNKAANIPSTHKSQLPIATVAAAVSFITNHISQDKNLTKNSDTTTFASVYTPKAPSTGSSSLDSRGNITGTTQPDLLASIVGNSQVLNTENAYQVNPVTVRNQLFIVGLMGILSMLYLVKRPRRPQQIERMEKVIDTSEKIFEIDQKMDGTVVLKIQGKEYKISKPELDSDSDQFIAALMKLVSFNGKEIEYDSFGQDGLAFSAPLSRLVTRLGFVGVKRDLFFPRTSKNRVLFRKYVTRDDLRAMHMNMDQVLRDMEISI